MSNLVALFIKYLPTLIQASESVPQIIQFVSEMRSIFSRHNLWTPEQEAQFKKELGDLDNDPAWQVKD